MDANSTTTASAAIPIQCFGFIEISSTLLHLFNTLSKLTRRRFGVIDRADLRDGVSCVERLLEARDVLLCRVDQVGDGLVQVDDLRE